MPIGFVESENNDEDEWTARLHEDESYPGSDMIITNSGTGEQTELSLTATYSEDYVESALIRYPDIKILSTSEVAEQFGDLDRVIASEFSNKEIQEITELNFDELVNHLTPFRRSTVVSSAAAGVAMATVVTLWPFVVGYMRKKITLEQLHMACKKVFPEIGKESMHRITFALILGPIYGWYVLATTAMSLTPRPQTELLPKYLEYKSQNR